MRAQSASADARRSNNNPMEYLRKEESAGGMCACVAVLQIQLSPFALYTTAYIYHHREVLHKFAD